MRRSKVIRAAVLAAAIGVALALGAAAQTGAGPETEPPPEPPLAFRERPMDDVAAFFPADAYNQGLSGRAMLCCLVTGERLSCAVVAEAPSGYGFGEAARRLSLEVRLTRESAAAWRSYGGPVRLPINFSNPRFEPPPAYEAAPRCGTRTYDPVRDEQNAEELLSAER